MICENEINNFKWICPICNNKFKSKRLLFEHKKESNHYKPRKTNIKYHLHPLENPICPFCGEKHESKSGMSLHQRLCKKNPNRDIILSNKLSKIQKEVQNTKEVKNKLSKIAKENNYAKYSKRKSIFYESKNNGVIRLDSSWELKVAKRLDELNVNWYKPYIRIPYIDNQENEKGYYPDFYVEDYKCFIEVKAPYIAKRQNKNGKIDYLKSHYDFIFWIEDEELCDTFELYNMNYPHEVEKEVDILANILFENYKKKINKTKKIKKSRVDIDLKEKRWQIIQNSNIDFQKFGWVGKISKLFGVSENCGGRYIRNNFPEFYKKCFKCKNLKLDL